MSNRLFLTLSDEELNRFESSRAKLGMSRSQYLRYLLEGQREIRPLSLKYNQLVQALNAIERDLKAIAMKDELVASDRLFIMMKLDDIKKLGGRNLPVDESSTGQEDK